ncbi:peptidase S8 and S53 subtilisin kexin sedolisin [Segniliparus rotundus DSM 44985]|uniref:Peptidase S8 and S53 subtilisin kexin sedolisin n=1 Tax=Segniliparus rotundus (strain ATCC BAA-972 / CDC 1076 / CIP 108378 / DSM 44985 / JCM 13578) TaxID=640132 RepID=D6ZDG5_SEGRD|nr:type VII secretion-associated serine protease mycosin [Segniliparus rotundus]ADG97229.1 peptidase S8 and S53 subtilisin kexin sedolisin [Segniliparus rotundus DSM 44985]
MTAGAHRARRALALTAVLAALTAVSLPPSAAAPFSGPPVVDMGALPANTAPVPPQPMEQRRACVLAGGVPDQALTGLPPDLAALDLPAAQRLARGEGQTVAVLGTGVARNPRLPELAGGGDYVGQTDGLNDCDGVGTLVAGVIAAQPAPGDGFIGIAPSAKILSLRVSSAMFNLKTPGDNPMLAQASVSAQALARAVVRAADLGATVIVVSSVLCIPADVTVNDIAAVGAAVRYAEEDKNVVVVAAAGDTDQANCSANPITGPGRPGDLRDWAGVETVSLPSLWQPYVLSTGSLTPQGRTSKSSLAGPWVGAAAPGEAVVSLSNAPDVSVANALLDEKGKPVPVQGSAYAAGYIAGVAALVRSRYPQLTAYQVMNRITQTAHNAARLPSSLVGFGTVDPLAALTWDLPAGQAHAPSDAAMRPPAPKVKQIAPPPPPPQDPRLPKTVALVGTGMLALVIGAAAAIATLRRKKGDIS